jgi:hypothetical protein
LWVWIGISGPSGGCGGGLWIITKLSLASCGTVVGTVRRANHVYRLYDTLKKEEREKDSIYIQRIFKENFDAFATLSHLLLATTRYVTTVFR